MANRARQSPPEWAEPYGYISGRFAIGTHVSLTEVTTESCSYPVRQVRSTRSVSHSNQVCSLSILHFALRLV